MLGKLVKDEMKSYRFSVGIVLIIGLAFTIFMKAICMLPYKEGAKEVIQMFSIAGYILILVLMVSAVSILMIVRFYTTMVGDRGYLTWTLPVTASTHIGAKLIGAFVWRIFVLVAMVAMMAIFFCGNYWIWLQDGNDMYSISWILQQMYGELVANITGQDVCMFILSLIEQLVLGIVGMLLIYMCIAVGQLFGKWRVLASIGCYLLILVIVQVISFIWTAFMVNAPEEYYEWMESITFAQDVGIGILTIVVTAAIGAGLYAITNFIFKKHLNLE